MYNPADLGAARAAEVARAQGRPTAITTGAPSSQFLNSLRNANASQKTFDDMNKTRGALNNLENQKRSELVSAQNQRRTLEQQLAEIQKQIDIEANAPPPPARIVGYYGSGIPKVVRDSETSGEDLVKRQRTKDSLTRQIESLRQSESNLSKDLSNISGAKTAASNASALTRTGLADQIKAIDADQPKVTPQRQRAKILQDQPASQFANPNFVTKSQQRQRDQARQDLSFSGVLDNVGLVANPLPQAFAETTQDLTTREQNKSRIDSIKQTIAKAKEAGATEITITSESGFTKTVPISSAYREIVKASSSEPVSILAQGASQSIILPPDIPAGTVLVGSISSPFLLEDKPSKIGPEISPTLKAAKEAGLGILQPVTSFLDAEFELTKPKEQRSERNRLIGEVTAPLSNLVGLGYDASRQIGGLIKGEEVFDPNTRAGALNLPQAKPQYVTEPQRTALGDLVEGRPVDFKSPFTQASLAGEAVLFGLPVGGGKAGGKIAKITTERKQTARDIKQIRSDLAEAVPPQTTEIRPFGAPESALNPKTRASDIIQSNLENVIGKPLTTKNKIRVKKTGPNEYDIESTSPLVETADNVGILKAKKVGKKEFAYEFTTDPKNTGGRITGIDVFGTIGKA
ncbi:MAG: hypothetical protein LV468_03035, partial [Candidatus Nitrosotenuis sp.]|nr:hypothetical protein [Candidatus Nitrosotenuis sp.]